MSPSTNCATISSHHSRYSLHFFTFTAKRNTRRRKGGAAHTTNTASMTTLTRFRLTCRKREAGGRSAVGKHQRLSAFKNPFYDKYALLITTEIKSNIHVNKVTFILRIIR